MFFGRAFFLAGLMVGLGACAIPLDQINGDRPTSGITLIVTPGNAKVFLDGQYVGRAGNFNGSPGVLRVVAGGHVLHFEAEGFQNERVSLCTKDEPETLRIQLLPRPKPAPDEG